jgi:hypothetical protein
LLKKFPQLRIRRVRIEDRSAADRQNCAGIAITNQSAAKVQIVYGSVTASINPEQIVEVLRIG